MPVEVMSRAQQRAWESGTVPPPEQLRTDTWVIPVPMPNVHIPYVLCYVLADDAGGVHLIDPGWARADAWEGLIRGLEDIGFAADAVRTVTVTHAHKDHIGLAKRLRDEVGATLTLGEIEAGSLSYMASAVPAGFVHATMERWGVPAGDRAALQDVWAAARLDDRVIVDLRIADGAALPLSGRDVRVVLTPGHTHGHLCIVDAENGLVFTGDHVLPTMNPGVGLGGPGEDNPLLRYHGSLELVGEFDSFEACPGHGYRFRGMDVRRGKIRAHIDRRADEVAEALVRSPGASVWDIARTLSWTEGWENLAGFRLKSALNQTEIYMATVRETPLVGLGI